MGSAVRVMVLEVPGSRVMSFSEGIISVTKLLALATALTVYESGPAGK